MAHRIVLVAEFEWYKGVEAARFILQATQLLHMIDAVLKFFYMSIKHGGIAVHAQRMCRFMNGQPSCAIYFICCDLLPYFRMKDFCTAPGKRVQPGFVQVFHTICYRHFRFAKHIVQLNGRKSFYM